ncbi:hypothetical protein HY374_03960 [Candidatus Berkelbacteria bacterium]|nr:hypothetical protein [Candidatus Berkelbacteria bacterium]
MRRVETIIVGGGVAGLGCARTLVDAGHKDFLLFTKDVGGRVTHAFGEQENFGAFYARDDYEHIVPFVKKRRRVNFWHAAFFRGWRKRTLHDLRNLPHLLSLIRLALTIFRMQQHYRRFRQQAQFQSQHVLVHQDAFLYGLTQITGAQLLAQLGAEYWGEYFIRPVVRGTSFVDVDDVPAIVMLVILLPAIVPSYEFFFDLENLTEPFAGTIKLASVTAVTKQEEGWEVTVDDGAVYRSTWLVLAVPPEEAKRLGQIEEPLNTPINVYLYSLDGEARAPYRDEPYNLLSPEHSDIALVREPDGSWLFASRRRRTDFSDYFTRWRVVAEKHWEPAFHTGTHIIDAERGDQLILAGDYNAPTMEDAYITGVYAANRILGKATV